MDTSKSDFRLFYDKSAENILDKYNIRCGQFVTIQRGVGDYNAEYPECLPRLWSVENYTTLVKLLKSADKTMNLKVIQVGSEFSVPIENVDFDLRGKTTFEELKVLLNYARFHIDGDAGMVHLRHFLSKKPSVVIFGPTNEKLVGYSENINISARPESCPVACEWLTPYWREKCIATGTNEATCQKNVTPYMVLEKILSYKNDA